ncbi:DUF4238 domain-containing protein [Pedobacter agri]|uniref:DUF4238 domain-containing protein n=1 Tax=Pedobacter agri TaxID=454586 RepID=UPI00277E7510|nr:DUF4238 domain-containing protein [Pedobacter agri]MDQ1139411.1 hypothetical protein [Pedobacter agri]
MKQHFLPECYLREFNNNDNKLYTLDTSYLKFGKKVAPETKTPAEVCRSIDFYTINESAKINFKHLKDLHPLAIENGFHNYESVYPKIIKKIKDKQQALPITDAKNLIFTLVDFKIRNQHFRDKVIPKAKNNVLTRIIEEMRSGVENLDLSQFPKIRKQDLFDGINRAAQVYDNGEVSYTEMHLSSLAMRNSDEHKLHKLVINHLLKFQWVMLESNNQFITNDNPGVSVDSNGVVQNTKFSSDYIYFFPLTPSLCLSMSPNVLDDKIVKNKAQKHILYRKSNNQFNNYVNELSGYHLNRYIFANNKKLINEIAEKINIIANF